jgi:hypothetical protein
MTTVAVSCGRCISCPEKNYSLFITLEVNNKLDSPTTATDLFHGEQHLRTFTVVARVFE